MSGGRAVVSPATTSGTSDGPAVTQKHHKNFVNLDISALNPFHQDRKSDDSATQAGDNGSTVNRPAGHEVGHRRPCVF
jgi:hypothetical protein